MAGSRFAVVLAAAGSSTRFRRDGGTKKQFLELAGRPILHWSLDVFASLEAVERVVVVGASEDLPRLEESIARWEDANRSARPKVSTTEGGARRQDSVLQGLRTVWDIVDAALVHDAARPLVRSDDVRRVLGAIEEHGAAVLGYPATDSIQRAEGDQVGESLDRRVIWQVQTPQGARCELFRRAYDEVGAREHTDEAALLRAVGVRPRLVEGARDNIKVTSPGDESLAEFLLRRREA